MAGVRLKAIVWGYAVALGAILAGSIALAFYLGLPEGAENMSPEEAPQSFDNFMQDPRVLRLAGFLDFLVSVLGGYVAARLAQSAPLLNAGCLGVVSVILGILFIQGSPPAVAQAMYIPRILTLPAALVGGLLARARNS